MAKKVTERDVETLTSIGLSKVQATVYLEALAHGMPSVLELSKRTGIHRQQIYEAAEKLVGMGLFDATSKRNRKYIPARPAKLVEFGKERAERLHEATNVVHTLLPQLEKFAATGKANKVTTKYYEGLERLKDAYADELRAAKGLEIVALAGALEDFYDFFPEHYWDKWNKIYAKSGVPSRMLVHDTPAGRKALGYDPVYKRDARVLKDLPLKINIDIFGPHVLMVSPYDALAIWIESRVIADSYRALFEALWTKADKAK